MMIRLWQYIDTVIGGDTEPETLFMHANDYRRWRVAQTIKKLGFSLYFWV